MNKKLVLVTASTVGTSYTALLPFSGIDYVPIRDEQGKYICDVCGETFTSSTSVRRHKINIHHKDGTNLNLTDPKGRYVCDLCGAYYARASDADLLSSTKLHGPNKRTRTVMFNAASLKTPEGRFLCNICGMSFAHVNNIKRHQQNIHERIRFVCQYCMKSFSQKGHLSSHIKSCHSSLTSCDLVIQRDTEGLG
ncbi:hypothetical protein LSH36_79g11054 [Paralvinella palmiformis]|uniref:C2H2-type domain-containing protein n=1 Tax=Paralvinella palmiformis TaxID=53620 RepID=A0AAD9K3P2_9ANNE|nr:hypothetical protein LSH36_79g11054 [Paralvinella palmiformis]